MDLPDLVQLKFDGGGISPNEIRLSELGRLLRLFEEYLVNQVRESQSITRDEIHLSLNSIRHASASYGVHSSMKEATLEAVYMFGRAVETNSYVGLVPSSKDLARQLVSFTRRHQCLAHVVARNGMEKYAATVTPDTQVGSANLIRGETQYYGVLEKIGGAEPRFVLRISEREALRGEIEQSLAVELAKRLYAWVGVSGIATWDPSSGDIQGFKASVILPYKGTGLLRAMDLLKQAVGEYWDDDEVDVLEATSKIRNATLP